MTLTTYRNIGSNRDKARLWIEGTALLSTGWTKGTEYWAAWAEIDGRPCIFFTTDETTAKQLDPKARKRKVAGTDSRPIIDTNTDRIIEHLATYVGKELRIHISGSHSIKVEVFDEAVHGKKGETEGQRG